MLKKPAIDTLYLSPLAFPENPYHRLVKDYQIVRDSINKQPVVRAVISILPIVMEPCLPGFQKLRGMSGYRRLTPSRGQMFWQWYVGARRI